MKFAAALAIGVAAVAIRFADLQSMPVHADEAVQASRFGDLLEKGAYTYDPNDYHGPVLLYATLPSAWLNGIHTYSDLTESVLRAVPAIAGGVLAFVSALLWWPAGVLVAASPAMIYYSRYYIPEMLFALVTFGLMMSGWWYARTRTAATAALTGIATGLLFATKETAILVIAAALLAAGPRLLRIPSRRDWLVFGFAALAVVVLLLGFSGAAAMAKSYFRVWVPRAAGDLHRQPWWFYFNLLGRTEAAIFAIGIVAAWRSKGLARFVALQSVILLLFYTLFAYKTPWCALTVIHGFALVAGYGLMQLRRPAAVALLAFACLFGLSTDASATWAYSSTSIDVHEIVQGLPPGERIQVISRQNVWPLPWYLRKWQTGWFRQVPENTLATVILATPEVEPELLRAMYESPPPGQRYLYKPLFDKALWLRPGVEIRGYSRLE